MRADTRRYRSDAFLSEATKIIAVGLIALSAGACSFSIGVVGMDEEEPAATGAITAKPEVTLSPELDVEDWRRAKAALGLALDPQGPGTQVSWDNPASGRRGAFDPKGAPFVKNDEVCRMFSAHLGGASTASLQGMACRPSGGEWAIKEIKPVKAAAKV